MSLTPYKVALIGSGAISYTYLDNMCRRFDILDVVGCSDIIPERSKARAEEFGIRQMTNEEILADPEISIVVNTTYPKSHYPVTKAALEAGKHVHSEKMLATSFEEGKELAALAAAKGLRLGAAPDTFLGGGYQTVRKLVDDGFIGIPLHVNALVMRGYNAAFPMELNPEPFVFGAGGTIPYDMGGYYIHAMVAVLGAIKRVTGFTRAHESKKYSHPMHPKYGQPLNLAYPTILQGSLEFENGVDGSLTVCSESFFPEVPRIEIYGTEGTLICPDPNTYGGPVMLRRNGNPEFYEIPITHGYVTVTKGWDREKPWADSRRGIGVADIAWALKNDRPHRCAAEIGVHPLEVIHGVMHSTATGEVYTMTTHPARPAALPAGFVGPDGEACLDN
jgi:predicted dehydrogenase